MKRSYIRTRLVNILAPFTVFIIAIILLFPVLTSCTSEEAAAAAVGTTALGLAGVWICFIVIFSLAGIFLFVVWILMIVDCAKREKDDFPDANENTKMIWILVVVLAGWIGAIIYYFMVFRKMSRGKDKKEKPPITNE